jgi:hypothetical protein
MKIWSQDWVFFPHQDPYESGSNLGKFEKKSEKDGIKELKCQESVGKNLEDGDNSNQKFFSWSYPG